MRKKKVAITGIHNSGKTVFLTSLLWQLIEIKRNKNFHLGNDIKISDFREIRSRDSGENTFEFRLHRQRMAYKKEWPQKTKDIHRFYCQFNCSRKEGLLDFLSRLLQPIKWLSQPFSQWSQQLDILDFPGERIADAAIAVHDDFGEWSNHMFGSFDYESGSRLQQALEAENVEFDTAVRAYRETLVSFIRDCKPLISPSVFFLDRKGELLDREKLESAASERPCGLDADSQFAPLPKSVLKNNPKLAKKMRRHFEMYRKGVVKPLFDDLATSDSLIVLIDIPSLLLGGVQRYNDNRQIISDLFGAIGKKKLKILSSLKRVAFVATKADMILRNDLERRRLTDLLRQMNEQAASVLPTDVDIGWFECSACWSTAPGSSEDTLYCVSGQNNPEKKDTELSITPLPDSWPPNWNPEEYKFPDVFPNIPLNFQIPPKHQELDEIFKFAVIR